MRKARETPFETAQNEWAHISGCFWIQPLKVTNWKYLEIDVGIIVYQVAFSMSNDENVKPFWLNLSKYHYEWRFMVMCGGKRDEIAGKEGMGLKRSGTVGTGMYGKGV